MPRTQAAATTWTATGSMARTNGRIRYHEAYTGHARQRQAGRNPQMRQSAGLVLYRVRHGVIEVLLVHPGGPFWVKRDDGAWTIPKGELDAGEVPLQAARREFREETGLDVEGPFHPLPPVRQAGGKRVHAFAVEGDCDATALTSATFELEWPPRSGRVQRFPEVDRAAWFTIAQASQKLNVSQRLWLDALPGLVAGDT